MSIPFFRYPHVFAQQRDEILAAMTEVMERGAFILQSDLVEFETALAGFTSAKYAIGVANGTDALTMALRTAGIGEGDEDGHSGEQAGLSAHERSRASPDVVGDLRQTWSCQLLRAHGR